MMSGGRRRGRGSRGIGLGEVIVLLAIVSVLILLLILYLPQQREGARLVTCRKNLGQIGLALGIYAQFRDGALPVVPDDPDVGPTTIAALLEFLGEPDFRRLRAGVETPPTSLGEPAVERRIPGLICPADERASKVSFAAPVSYRANAGSATDGRNGPFAPGRPMTLAEIEEADGLAYTAAFAERLLGDGSTSPGSNQYRHLGGPLPDGGCPDAGDWLGDAGSSWNRDGWETTRYNHALAPGSGPSCVSADRRSAYFGVSSGHASGAQILRLDGSVREFSSQTDLKVWRALGNAFDSTIPVKAPMPAVSAAGPD